MMQMTDRGSLSGLPLTGTPSYVHLWQALFKDTLGIKPIISTAYHPQTDGQSEKKNQMVEIVIRYHMAVNPQIPRPDVSTAM